MIETIGKQSENTQLNINKIVAINLAIYLLKENKSMRDLQEETGISYTTLSNIKKAKGIHFKTIGRLAQALNIKPYQLFVERSENL